MPDATTELQINWEAILSISNIVLSVLSITLVIVSVAIAILTLRQNNKMIESSTRPYIGITCEIFNTGTMRHILMIKNYGNSAGIIESVKFDADMHGALRGRALEPFEHIEGTSILPGQVISTVIDYDYLKEHVERSLGVTVRYSSFGDKIYEDTFHIGLAVNSTRMTSRTSTKDKELQTISYTLQEIAERLV